MIIFFYQHDLKKPDKITFLRKKREANVDQPHHGKKLFD